MISLVELTAALQRAWVEADGDQTPTQFPGMPLDATRLPAWFEFWITQIDQPPQRQPGVEMLTLVLDLHCFSRRAEKRHVMAMADRVRQVFSRRALPLASVEAGFIGEGMIRLRESAIRDLTRETGKEPALPIQHLVVSISGRVEFPSGTVETEE